MAGVAGAIIGARGGLGGDTAGEAAGAGGLAALRSEHSPSIGAGSGGVHTAAHALNNISNKLDTARPAMC
jgi:hypothetical protein